LTADDRSGTVFCMAIGDGEVQRRTPNPGSQSALRQDNSQRIISALLGAGPSSQAELSRLTGLSTATVSNIVGVLTERGIISTTPTTSSGRRALSVRLADTGAIAIGIFFGRSHLRALCVSPDYRVVAEECVDLDPHTAASSAVDVAAEVLPRLRRQHGLDAAAVLGVGVGIPAPVDRRTMTVVEDRILPEWAGIRAAELEDRLGGPVYLGNDADLGALAEMTWGVHGEAKHLVFLRVGSGIGAGLILDGAPYRGNIGVTGEIGHLPVGDGTRSCSCGRTGCLETVASTRSMVELLANTGAVASTSDLMDSALAGDARTLAVIGRAGEAIGHALALVANLINPRVVVIGGPVAALGDSLLKPVRVGLERHAIARVAESTELVLSTLGDRGSALGAATLVLQQPGIPLARW
jgi:predicted NBD/HSP70 family sugar kinase